MSADENPTMFDKFRASADERPEAIILGVLNLIRTVPEYPLKLGKPKSKIVEAIFFNPYNFFLFFFYWEVKCKLRRVLHKYVQCVVEISFKHRKRSKQFVNIEEERKVLLIQFIFTFAEGNLRTLRNYVGGVGKEKRAEAVVKYFNNGEKLKVFLFLNKEDYNRIG